MSIRGWNFDKILPIFHSVTMSTRGWYFDKIFPIFHTYCGNEHPWMEFWQNITNISYLLWQWAPVDGILTKYSWYFKLSVTMSTLGWNFDKISQYFILSVTMSTNGWDFDEIFPIFHRSVTMNTRGCNVDKIFPIFHTKCDNEHLLGCFLSCCFFHGNATNGKSRIIQFEIIFTRGPLNQVPVLNCH